jgi:GAF domain-containing protein
MTHGWSLVSHLGLYEEGVAFGELSLRLNEKFNNVDLTCKLNGIFGSYTHFVKPLRSRIDFLRKAYRAGLVTGDFPYLSYNCFHTVLVRLGLGDELGAVREEIDTFFAIMKRTRDAPSTAVLTLAKQIIANLKGQTRRRCSLSDDSFDEAAFAAANDGSDFIACAYYTARTELLFLHGDYEGALIASSLAEPRVASSGGFYYTTELSFYTCLTLLGLPPAPADAERAQRATRLAYHRAKLAEWASHCPANYLHADLLLLAEEARASGDELKAMDLYDQAIRLAGANGFPHHAAMANELAGRFYLRRGQEKVAFVYLKEACAGYGAWGAVAKVADLEERYEYLRSPHGPTAPPPVAGIGAIDLLAVIRASQALSSEIDRGELLKRLMTSALESAGAERGCLLRGPGDDLRVEAEAFVHEDEVHVSLHGGAPPSLVPPEPIMNYVKKTQEVLILDDAAVDPRFAWDEQVTARGLKSVLCLPLMRQGVRVGMLYLENNLTTGAFVRSRVAVLELLASQAAISLENAVLYEELRQENEERRRAEAVLSEKLELIERQQETIRVLSTPIIEVWNGVLTVPVLGVLDERRAAELMQSLLDAVTRKSCRYAILDLTGVESVDEATAAHVIKLVGALRLVGARGIVVGIRGSVARTLVSAGSELSGITTLSNLRQALVFCVRRGCGQVTAGEGGDLGEA